MTPTSKPDIAPDDPALRASILTAEQAYVGSLLWLDLDQAAVAVVGLHPDDFTSAWTRQVHGLIAELCRRRVSPDPAAVLALAMEQDWPVDDHRIRTLTQILWTLYDHRSTVPASCRWYAARALEQRIRRRVVEQAVRLRQVAGHADLDELDRLSRSEQLAVDRLRARLQALDEPLAPQAAAA